MCYNKHMVWQWLCNNYWVTEDAVAESILLKAWIMHAFDTLKRYTNAHTIGSRPRVKDVKCFWHWSVCKLYERSIYKHNFSSTKLWQIHSQTALNSQQKRKLQVQADMHLASWIQGATRYLGNQTGCSHLQHLPIFLPTNQNSAPNI